MHGNGFRRSVFQRIIVMMVLLIVAAGCGGKDNADDTITVAVIPMGTTHEYWKAIHAGAVKAQRELGIDIIWKGPLKEDDVDEQIQIVETQIAAGVDAFVLAPFDKNALARPVIEAQRRGIPTVVIDSELYGDAHVGFVSTDNYEGGAKGARHLGTLMNGTGKVILIRVVESSASSTKREEGFLATIRDEFPGIEILSDNQYGGITTETAYRTCENLLNRFPEVEGIFTPNESVTFGCLRALQDRGLVGKIVFVGFDNGEKQLEAIRNGEMQGLVVQDPFSIGYHGVKTAAAYLKKEPFEAQIDTDAVVITSDNIDDTEIRELLRSDYSEYLE